MFDTDSFFVFSSPSETPKWGEKLFALAGALLLFCKTPVSMKDLMTVVSAIALTMAAINSQAQNSESQPRPTFTYQITSVEKDSSDLKIQGIIRNTGPTLIKYMFVESVGYNSNHEIIGTGNAIPVINFSLLTNQTVHFQTEILNNTGQEIASYSLNFDTGSTPDVTPTPYVVPATPPPLQPPVSVTATTIPMPKEMQEKIAAERAAQANEQRELFNKQEAEREANGDFSQAPGLTPEQREAAAVKWAKDEAAKRIKAATPYPQ